MCGLSDALDHSATVAHLRSRVRVADLRSEGPRFDLNVDESFLPNPRMKLKDNLISSSEQSPTTMS